LDSKADEIQRRYYQTTAAAYDDMHVHSDDEHYRALRYISSLLPMMSASSILDVGCGTGRGVKYFLKEHPGLRVQGIEPVPALIERAYSTGDVPPGAIMQGSGERLPFSDQYFDAVFECGVLHHVRDTRPVVLEMMRVARKAIFLSDENRFAHGRWTSKLIKLALWKSGAFRSAYFLKTLGRGYRYSEGDGVAYSYSVYDAFDLLTDWADTTLLIPTQGRNVSNSWFHPLLTSFHVLLCAIRETPNQTALSEP
jgi:ubiquinone/menaquinone biosynthesis C-methylase UbiE